MRIVLNALLLMISCWAVAQQPVTSAMWSANQQVMNPAMGLQDSSLLVGVNARRQWMGFQGAPQRAQVFFQQSFNRIGAGVQAQSETFGAVSLSSVALNGAYRLPLSGSVLSVGLRLSGQRVAQQFSGLNLNDAGDPRFSQNSEPAMFFNAGIGFHWRGERWMIYGMLPELNSRRPADFFGPSYQQSDFLQKQAPAAIGAEYRIGKPERLACVLMTGVIREYASSSDGVFSVELAFRQRVSAGFQYRHTHSQSGWVGLRVLKNLDLGFAYEGTRAGHSAIGTSELRILYHLRK